MADIQYDPACMDCRRDNGKDLAGTTWQCAGHVRAERDSLRAKLANVMVEWKHDVEVLTNERNAALTLAEQRGAAYDIEQGLRQKAEHEQARAEERASLKYPQWHRVWESEYLARRMAEDEVEKANRYGNEYLNRLIVAESTRDLHWREVESLREWKDKLEAKVDEITALVDEWRDGRAHLGTPATFVDQRLLDDILKIGISVSGQRGGTVTFSHWSGTATKPDEEHGAQCKCCKGDGYYGVADGDGDVDIIICESLASQRDSWHKEAEAWKQTAANLQTRADRFEFLRELLVAVARTGTKDPLLDARLAEELRSHE